MSFSEYVKTKHRKNCLYKKKEQKKTPFEGCILFTERERKGKGKGI